MRPSGHSSGGSSPRGRGKLGVATRKGGACGLIPAWAGKTSPPSRSAAGHAGSSPRGRGKPTRSTIRAIAVGLIPAWAGKTTGSNAPSSSPWAHPRVGGENHTGRWAGRGLQGSSPRGRGKRPKQRTQFLVLGLIPAWAGKTLTRPPTTRTRRAHPRVGGENASCSGLMPNAAGSSPRGRGKLDGRPGDRWHQGLIPAWAGKTLSGNTGHQEAAAHPRVGGENHATRDDAYAAAGLIPAWAGKTHPIGYQALGTRAHPRVGGENKKVPLGASGQAGSSPRGRGKHMSSAPARVLSRLIPAWAGKTYDGLIPALRSGAHPRVGGENERVCHLRVRQQGSSPRGRGKRSRRDVERGDRGLIPAWAGKTPARPWRPPE